MIRVGGVPEHFNFPFRKGLSQDYFLQHDLELAWNEFPGGTGAMLEALHRDQLDAATLLTEGAFKAIAQGYKLKIAQFYVKSPLIWGVHTAFNNQEVFQETKEVEYLISRPLSGSHLMADIFHSVKYSENIGNKFKVIENLNGALQHFRAHGKGYFLWERFTTDAYTKTKALKRIGEVPTPWPSFVLVVSEKAIAEKTQEVEALKKLLPTLCSMLSKSESTLNEIETMYELEHENAVQWYENLEWKKDHSSDFEMLKQTVDSLQELQVIDASLTVTQFLDE